MAEAPAPDDVIIEDEDDGETEDTFTAPASKSKKSPVWAFFQKSENYIKAPSRTNT